MTEEIEIRLSPETKIKNPPSLPLPRKDGNYRNFQWAFKCLHFDQLSPWIQ